MSFFHKKNVTKCLGHHYAIWTSDSNFLLAQKKFSGRPKASLISSTDGGSDLSKYIYYYQEIVCK